MARRGRHYARWSIGGLAVYRYRGRWSYSYDHRTWTYGPHGMAVDRENSYLDCEVIMTNDDSNNKPPRHPFPVSLDEYMDRLDDPKSPDYLYGNLFREGPNTSRTPVPWFEIILAVTTGVAIIAVTYICLWG